MPIVLLPAETARADHRPRVAAGRRERTRALLLESALIVFARRGLEAGVIEDVISTAGVSRGTFYNYFRTHEALFAGVAEALSNEFVRHIDPLVLAHADPAARVAAGLRYALRLAREYPVFAGFISRGGVRAVRLGGEASAKLMRDVAAGMQAGRFLPLTPALVEDLVLGAVVAALDTVSGPSCDPQYPEQFACSILQALGTPHDVAGALSCAPLEPLRLPEDALLVRAARR